MGSTKRKTETTLRYFDVAPCIPLAPFTPQAYTYHAPKGSNIELYTRVQIPFGPRTVAGVVVAERTSRVSYRTKELIPHSPIQLTARQVAFAQWISTTMQGGFGYTLRLFFPASRPPALPAGQAGGEAGLAADATSAELLTKPDRSTTPPAALLRDEPRPSGRAAQAIIEHEALKRWEHFLKPLHDVRRRQQQAVILVPETWLLKPLQTFIAAQVDESVVIVDASLGGKQQLAAWTAVRAGTVNIIIGTQKALFLPWRDLGLIILEAEYYSAHKLWDQYPRLDNRYGARALTTIHGASLIYAGALPSLSLAHAIAGGSVPLLANHPLSTAAQVFAVAFTDRKAGHVLPQEFLDVLRTWLKAKERVVLLHNSLGTWQSLVCRSCHKAVRCQNCGSALAVMGKPSGLAPPAGRQQLTCRHCGFSSPFPATCPLCGKGKLYPIGAGLEKMGEVIAANIPASVRITEVTARTTTPLSSSKLKRAEVIIGTSAVLTRLNGIHVDRAVYLTPERSLLYPDFRSTERTYYTLARLQELLPPRRRVAIVTRQTELIADELLSPLPDWTARQLKQRAQLGYPPVADAVLLTTQGRSTKQAQDKALVLRTQLDARAEGQPHVTIRGPFTSFMKQRRGRYEQHILLLGQLAELTKLYVGLPTDFVDVAPERIL